MRRREEEERWRGGVEVERRGIGLLGEEVSHITITITSIPTSILSHMATSLNHEERR